MGVGLNIKEILRDKKMTIKQLAEQTNIPLNTLYSITKRDSERVDKIIINRIAAALECDPYSLMSFDMASDALFDRINAQECMITDCGKMNDEGVKLAAELVHLVAESPRYRRADAPPPSPEGKDTPAAEPPENPAQNGE